MEISFVDLAALSYVIKLPHSFYEVCFLHVNSILFHYIRVCAVNVPVTFYELIKSCGWYLFTADEHQQKINNVSRKLYHFQCQ